MEHCVSGKTIYQARELAEQALIEAWIRNHYREGSGPVNIYPCEDCKRYHFTSQGMMNTTLKKALEDGIIEKRRNSADWERKFGW